MTKERRALMIAADNLFNGSSEYNFCFLWIAQSQLVIPESQSASKEGLWDGDSQQHLVCPVVLLEICSLLGSDPSKEGTNTGTVFAV